VVIILVRKWLDAAQAYNWQCYQNDTELHLAAYLEPLRKITKNCDNKRSLTNICLSEMTMHSMFNCILIKHNMLDSPKTNLIGLLSSKKAMPKQI